MGPALQYCIVQVGETQDEADNSVRQGYKQQQGACEETPHIRAATCNLFGQGTN